MTKMKVSFNMSKIIALSIAFLFISGCKVAVILVEGGEVQSAGSGTCQVAVAGTTGTVCIHEVSDTNYSETFEAVPGSGWQFVKWNSGDGFLCKDSTSPVCVVDNTGLAGISVIDAIVASDATLYIMPIFQRIACDPSGVCDFTEAYNLLNWTQSIGGDGSINVSGAPAEVSLTGSDTDGGVSYNTDLTILAIADGEVTFDWSFSSNDESPSYDPFGYLLNGAFTILTDGVGGLNQSGSASFAVSAGDTFGFRQNTEDDCCGSGESATTIVSHFAVSAP
jgi:hypothetical protein